MKALRLRSAGSPLFYTRQDIILNPKDSGISYGPQVSGGEGEGKEEGERIKDEMKKHPSSFVL
jgi:hypothetical protein